MKYRTSIYFQVLPGVDCNVGSVMGVCFVSGKLRFYGIRLDEDKIDCDRSLLETVYYTSQLKGLNSL